MNKVQKVLFICSQNKLRSPTAEQVFSSYPELEVLSAGTNNDAEVPVSPELILWAEKILVMEQTHRNKIRKKFGKILKEQKIICLGIPDEFEYMDPELIKILMVKVPQLLNIKET